MRNRVVTPTPATDTPGQWLSVEADTAVWHRNIDLGGCAS